MSEAMPLPATKFVGELLTGIIGRRVLISKPTPLEIKAKTPKIYGIYRDSGQPITCLAVCDLSLCAYVGGAMLMFPVCAIEQAIKSGTLEEAMMDSVREILNISSRMFNDHGHQVLRQVCTAPGQLPSHAASVLQAPVRRLDMAVSVENYGKGQMSVLIGPNENG